jgi:hypothetical protein
MKRDIKEEFFISSGFLGLKEALDSDSSSLIGCYGERYLVYPSGFSAILRPMGEEILRQHF